MELQTKVPLEKAVDGISYKSRIFLIGSCFAEHIGAKLQHFQFQSCLNPMGIYFHPKAIENLLERIITGRPFEAGDVFEHGEQWHSFEAHSRLSQGNKEAVFNVLNDQLQLSQEYLRSCSHIFLTLGTAWAYQHKTSGKWVANCHKLPQKAFIKQLWDVEALEQCLLRVNEMIYELNPKAQLVCSISPVRHLKDGFLENQRSKAHLLTAVHKLLDASLISYFPSYELLMDELRDYRFYDTDLVHPNALAIDYIWEKFKEAWITEDSFPVMEEVDAIRKGLAHRPFNPESEAHLTFVELLNERIAQLQDSYPFMNFL